MAIGIMTSQNLIVSLLLQPNDEAIEEIWNKQFPLKPFLAAENFKSYDELKAKLDKVLSGVRNTGTAEDVAIPPAAPKVEPVVEETVSSPTPAPVLLLMMIQTKL